MANVKRGNMFKHVQNNVAIAATTKFASSLTAKVCLFLAMQSLFNLISKGPSFFPC